MSDDLAFPGVESEDEFIDLPGQDYEEALLKQMRADLGRAEENMTDIHADIRKWYKEYRNARNYRSLRKENRFPATVIQEDVDQLVAQFQDKLWFKTPCTIVGVEEGDRADAEAKQALLSYQDRVTGMFIQFERWERDALLYPLCVAQVDYKEKSRKEWVELEKPKAVPEYDEEGFPLLDEAGKEVPALDENGELIPMYDGMGQPVMDEEMEWDLQDVTYFKGAWSKRVDPLNVFYPPELKEVGDGAPIMIRSILQQDFFEEDEKFFNTNRLKDEGPGEDQKHSENKKDDGRMPESGHEYYEYYGRTNRKKLFQFLEDRQLFGRLDNPELIEKIGPKEKTWFIGGFVNEILVQARPEPFQLDKPNIVIGYMIAAETGPEGIALSEKLAANQGLAEDLMGMTLESFKQVVNSPWVIKGSALVNKDIKVNEPGSTIMVDDDPNRCVLRVTAGGIAPDAFRLLEMNKQSSEDRGGVQGALTGEGEPSVSTLGQSNQILGMASLRVGNYLKTFEASFVEELYRMRNHINAALISKPFVVRILGEKGMEWRTYEPGQLRSSCDYLCESSIRENNRAILSQQLLQVIDLAPHAIAAGQPVRIDRLIAELGMAGFSWDEEKVGQILPLIGFEKKTGADLNELIVQNALGRMSIEALMPDVPGTAGPGGDQGIPEPNSEEDAVAANQERNETQVGRF